MERVAFDQWWEDFLRQCEARTTPSEAAEPDVEELTRYAESLPTERQAAFAECLAQVACERTAGWRLATTTLEHMTGRQRGDKALARLAVQADNLSNSQDPQDQNARMQYLRVLAGSDEETHQLQVSRCLLHETIGPFWSHLPWAVWPDRPELFGKSWARYFRRQPVAQWRDTIVVQAFLLTPAALVAVREALRPDDPAAWDQLRSAVLDQTDAAWLNDAQRSEVLDACEVSGTLDG